MSDTAAEWADSVAPRLSGDAAPDVLLVVPNHHQATDGGANMPPEPGPDQFVAYAPNRHGEQIVVIGDAERLQMYHGDYAWVPVELANGQPAGFIASQSELAWLRGTYELWEDWRGANS